MLEDRIENILNNSVAAVNRQNDIAITCYKSEASYSAMSYFELVQHSKILADQMANIGISPERKVVLCGKNSLDWVVMFFAIIQLKAIPVLIDPNLPVEQKLVLYKQIDPNLIIQENIPEYNPEQLSNVNIPVYQFDIHHFVSHRNFAKQILEANSSMDQGISDAAVVVFTSGTTGQMQAVMLSHKAVFVAIDSLCAINRTVKKEVVFNPLPFYHIYPLVVLLKTLKKRDACITCENFSPAIFRVGLHQNAITTLITVPRLLENLKDRCLYELAQKRPFIQKNLIKVMDNLSVFSWLLIRVLRKKIRKKFLNHVECIITGGSNLSTDIEKFFETLGIPLLNGYGLSETCGCAVAKLPASNARGTVGRPLPGIKLKIDKVDEEGVGEILIKSPSMMSGYFRNPEATKNSFDFQEFYRTGDLGKLDHFGNLIITGRLKELIINPDGKKVLCSQLDSYYQDIPGIAEIAAFGMPVGQTLNETPHLAVVLDDNIVFSDVKNALFGRAKSAPGHWQISAVHEVKEIPKTTMGKIKRTELKNRFLNLNLNSVEDAFCRQKLSGVLLIIHNVWAEVLKVDKVPIDEPFLSVGGNSLAAMEIFDRLEAEYGRNTIELQKFLAADTIEKQANLCRSLT